MSNIIEQVGRELINSADEITKEAVKGFSRKK